LDISIDALLPPFIGLLKAFPLFLSLMTLILVLYVWPQNFIGLLVAPLILVMLINAFRVFLWTSASSCSGHRILPDFNTFRVFMVRPVIV